MKVIVFDIDGTIANIEHRKHHIETKPKNWDAFYNTMHMDEPIPDVIELLNLFHQNGYKIILATGRSQEYQNLTHEWLIKHNLVEKITKVYMRRTKDFRPDYVVKEEILKTMKQEGYDPWMVFEDRSQVVDMWRKNGIRCMQVCPGDY